MIGNANRGSGSREPLGLGSIGQKSGLSVHDKVYGEVGWARRDRWWCCNLVKGKADRGDR